MSRIWWILWAVIWIAIALWARPGRRPDKSQFRWLLHIKPFLFPAAHIVAYLVRDRTPFPHPGSKRKIRERTAVS